MFYYEVAPLRIVRSENATFTYHTDEPLPLGSFVSIPIGKQIVTGLVIKSANRPIYDTKPITEALAIPRLPLQLISVSVWMSQYYATHLATVLQTVLPSGITKKRRKADHLQKTAQRHRTNYVFTKSQLAAIEQISHMSTGSAILHGITGSGKTAVYLELIQQQFQKGRSSIVLVPEIALTSQLVAEVSQHFEQVFVTHSKQTESERHNIWLAIANSNQPVIVVGPRSALFLPIASLGLIVIDEAHEPSYKQEQAPRYSALRVASILAQQHEAKVIQGSATPLVSEYFLAKHAARPIIVMDQKARTETKEPGIELIDMTKRVNFSKHRFLSNQLLRQIEINLDQHKQSLIFHNRRGSASTTLCENCGWSAICEHCFVPLTLHSDQHQLICHICGNHEKVPTSCPVCRSTDVIHKGIGTKLIEDEIKKLFPKANVARFDGDTSSETTVENRYQQLYNGDIDIIIGTQVIAKGLDLPHLRSVGVIQADAGLSLPDYVSSERTFQLLAQVVGRVGRNTHQTSVVVQSYQPDDPAVSLGLHQKYDQFYTQTIKLRQQSKFPPFTHLLKLTCVYKTEAAAVRNAKSLAEKIKSNFNGIELLGPTPAFYERQRDTFRWQLIVKSPSRDTLLKILTITPNTHWQTDIDPASLL